MSIHADDSPLTAAELAMLTPEELLAITKEHEADDEPEDDKEPVHVDDPAPAARPPIQLEVAQRDFAGELADLRNRYEEGELSQADYDAGLIDIGAAQAATQVTHRLNQKFAEQEWNQAQEDFYSANTRFNGPAMRAALGNAVERLESQHGGGNLPSSTLLARAAAIVDRELGLRSGPKPSVARVASVAVADHDDAHSDRSNDSPTLTGLEAKFAALDRLTGLEYENAIMRLSPSERRAYERM